MTDKALQALQNANIGEFDKVLILDAGLNRLMRKRYIKKGLEWTFDEMMDHQELLRTNLESRKDADKWGDCLRHLSIALRLKEEEGGPEYKEYLKLHLSENFDLCH